MPAATRLTVRLLDAEAADQAAEAPDTLVLIRHGGSVKAAGEGSRLATGLPVLSGPATELWTASTAVGHDVRGPFAVRSAGNFAVAAAVFPDDGDLAPVVETAYRALHSVADEIDRPHVLRTWQYFPGIHERQDGGDRYQRFCAGRRRALDALALPAGALPAASLLGDATPGLLLYALLGARPGRQVENPRQVSAFRYPARYGSARPAFSRAVAGPKVDAGDLYISGTASITGHASRHAAVTAQLGEIIENLEALLAAADLRNRAPAGLPDIAPLKVYVRRPGDLAAVRAALEPRLPAGHPLVYLRADICRRELLVEAEGLVAAG